MIAVVGLSHKTAPISVRERLVIDREATPLLLKQTVSSPEIGEAFLVSTCNRVELVVASRDQEAKGPDLVEAAARILTRGVADVDRHLYRYTGGDAVRHLFRVAASLDSMVVGEPQILGQLKQAYDLAQEVGTLGASLHRVVSRALRAAKRVRTETSIGSGQVSVPTVAVDLARQIFGSLAGRLVVLIGSGEMAEAVAKLLGGAGVRVIVTGRNLERVGALAESIHGQARPFDDLPQLLAEADMVVTSTGAHHHLISQEALREANRHKRSESLFLIDLAVPRNVDPLANELDGVFLYNIDDLSRAVASSLDVRRREAERAEAIVQVEVRDFDRWVDTMAVTPTIVALRERFRAVLDIELERSLKGRLKHLGLEEREALNRMVEAAVNKLMHAPSSCLKKHAADPALEALPLELLIQTLTKAFNLGENDSFANGDAPLESDSRPSHAPLMVARSRVTRGEE